MAQALPAEALAEAGLRAQGTGHISWDFRLQASGFGHPVKKVNYLIKQI